MGGVERGDGFPKAIAPAPIEVDHGLDAGLVHLGEVIGDHLGFETVFAAAQVIVDIDHRVAWFLHPGDLGLEHGPGLPVLQLELANIFLGSFGLRLGILGPGRVGQHKGSQCKGGYAEIAIHGSVPVTTQKARLPRVPQPAERWMAGAEKMEKAGNGIKPQTAFYGMIA